MPIENLEDFKKQYYGIINDIAFTPQDQRNGKALRWQKQLATLRLEAQGKGVDIQNFGCDFNTLQQEDSKSHLKELSQFYQNIRDSKDVTQDMRDIAKLEVPEANKQEIKAQGFVLAFDEMRAKANDKNFQAYYQNVQRMGKSDLREVGRPEFQRKLKRTNEIFTNFDQVYKKAENKEKLNIDEMLKGGESTYRQDHLVADGYWYTDKDIDAVLEQRLKQVGDQNIYQMDAVGLYSEVEEVEGNRLTTERIRTRLNEIGEPKAGKKLLIPVNVGGNHWIGAAVEFGEDNKAKVTYSNSLGDINNRKEALDKLIGDAIGPNVNKEFVIHDNPQRQDNAHDCGPLTVENLIRVAAPGNEITGNIRQQQAQLFGEPKLQKQEKAVDPVQQRSKMPEKQEKSQTKQKESRATSITAEQVKEQIARKILKVAGVSDEQIDEIMKSAGSENSYYKKG